MLDKLQSRNVHDVGIQSPLKEKSNGPFIRGVFGLLFNSDGLLLKEINEQVANDFSLALHRKLVLSP